MSRGVALVLAALLGLAPAHAWGESARGQAHLGVEMGLQWERRPDGGWVWGWFGGPGSSWRARWDARLERGHLLLEGWLDDGRRPFRLRIEAGPERP